ncbi:MAG: hypothetical protein ACRCZS_11615 [Chroococcidiopsis sp.]
MYVVSEVLVVVEEILANLGARFCHALSINICLRVSHKLRTCNLPFSRYVEQKGEAFKHGQHSKNAIAMLV